MLQIKLHARLCAYVLDHKLKAGMTSCYKTTLLINFSSFVIFFLSLSKRNEVRGVSMKKKKDVWLRPTIYRGVN